MTVFTNCSREGMISTDFKCASHGAVDALARTMLGTASEEMATNGIVSGTTSTGAYHADRD